MNEINENTGKEEPDFRSTPTNEFTDDNVQETPRLQALLETNPQAYVREKMGASSSSEKENIQQDSVIVTKIGTSESHGTLKKGRFF